MNITRCLRIFFNVLLVVFIAVALSNTNVVAAKKAAAAGGNAPGHHAVIEEVTSKQLERILNDKDFVAVYWCKC